MTDYTIYYKKELPAIDGDWSAEEPWDLFLSAYQQDERVWRVFDQVPAQEKHWLMLPAYGFQPTDYPTERMGVHVFVPRGDFEETLIKTYFDQAGINNLSQIRLCIDITGFLRPHLIFLVRYLLERRVRKIDVIYTEPGQYLRSENTAFSGGGIEVRQVAQYEGYHNPVTNHDVLILGVGYETDLISKVIEQKKHARRFQIFGLPSLRADMFQQNVLKVHQAVEGGAVAYDNPKQNHFAPAHDPFVTANVLREIVRSQGGIGKISNLYLCPLATKAQVLGFALYYLTECRKKPVSMIFPFAERYAKETGRGVSRIWKYTLELPHR